MKVLAFLLAVTFAGTCMDFGHGNEFPQGDDIPFWQDLDLLPIGKKQPHRMAREVKEIEPHETSANKSRVFLENLLVPKQILITSAKVSSAVCIEFEVADSFKDCNIKRPNITLSLVISHKNFPLMQHSLHFNHTNLCRPMRRGRVGHFCVEYDRNEIPEKSKIAFRWMFIALLVLDCRERAHKLASQHFNLLSLPTSEKFLNRRHIKSCPTVLCSKWLEKEDACRPSIENSSRFFPLRKVNRGTETLLIVGVVFVVWSIVWIAVQCAYILRRTTPSEKQEHLSAKSSSSFDTLPSALHTKGADGHLDLVYTNSE